MNTISRRRFLVSAGAIAPSIWGWSSSISKAASQAAPIVRKDARCLSPDEITKLREAFRRVKLAGPGRPVWANHTITLPDLASQNRVGYAYQAMIHTYHCPHRNWWFLPWHRAYLYTFEQILIHAVSDFMPATPLAIPYWNWTDQRALPPIFAQGGAANPLFDERRYSIPITDEDVGPAVMANVLSAPDFTSFGSDPACTEREGTGEGALEGGPHDTVHGDVGGPPNADPNDPSSWGTMTTTYTSAFDPIFWSHHANIDRLWNVWAAGAGHSNPDYAQPCPDGTSTWGGLVFNEFVDTQGATISRTVQDFLEDPAIRSVSYAPYCGPNSVVGTDERKSKLPKPRPLEVASEKAADVPLQLELERPITLTVPVSTELRARMLGTGAALAPVVFRVEGVQKPVDFTNVRVRAFLNNPKADATTSYKDPSYIGYFAFFDSRHPDAHMMPEGSNYSLNLAPALRRMAATLEGQKPLTITLVMVPKVASTTQRKTAKPVPFHGGRLIIQPENGGR
jgi:tyrosinase